MRWKTLCVALACWGILTTGRPVEAQTSASPPAPANTPDQLIEKLQRENEALRARLAELERVSGGTSLIKAALDADKPEAPPPARPAIAPPKGPGLPQGLEDSDSPFCLEKGGHDSHPQDLTLWNFFSAGWNEEYTRRDSEERAPDLALLRVQTNFMEREVRLNYADTSNFRSTTKSNLDNLDYFIAYAFDRRFMVEVLGNYQWQEGRGKKNPDESGQAARFVGRVQLISTQDSSYTFNFQAISPDINLGVHTTTFSYGSAGFEDLTRFGLYRVGLYGSILFDSIDGPAAGGTTRTDVQYDLTLAKTLTKPNTPLIGNFTVFVENFAQTNLDGAHGNSTLVSITPGIRFNLGKLPGNNIGIDNWIMFGTDIPVAGPKPWDTIYRLTYIKNF